MSKRLSLLHYAGFGFALSLLFAITFYTKEFFELIPNSIMRSAYPVVTGMDYILLCAMISIAISLVTHSYKLARTLLGSNASGEYHWLQTPLWFYASTLLLVCAPVFAVHHTLAKSPNATDIHQFITSSTGVITLGAMFLIQLVVFTISARAYITVKPTRSAQLWLIWRPLALLGAAIVSNAPTQLTALIFITTILSILLYWRNPETITQQPPLAWTTDAPIRYWFAIIFMAITCLSALFALAMLAPQHWFSIIAAFVFLCLGITKVMGAKLE